MQRLDGMDPSDTAFEPQLRELMADIREHVLDEERNLLPQLSTAAGLEETNRMGEAIALAKEVAPTTRSRTPPTARRATG